MSDELVRRIGITELMIETNATNIYRLAEQFERLSAMIFEYVKQVEAESPTDEGEE